MAQALAIVDEAGLDGLTMARLATDLDLTPGALYRYFEGKDALVVELQAICLDDMVRRFDALQDQVSPPGEPATAALLSVLLVARFYQRLPVEDARAYRLISLTLADPRPVVTDDAAERVREPLQAALSRVAQLLGDAADAGALEPGDAIGRSIVLWSSLHGVVQMAKLDRLAPGLFTSSVRVPQLVAAVLRGWGAPAPALDDALSRLQEIP